MFDPASGETHFLNELPSLLLEFIDQQPRTVDQLIALLNDGDPLDDAATQSIDIALAYLEQAELVESVTC